MVRQKLMPAVRSSGRGGARVSPPGGGLGRRGCPEAAAQTCVAGLLRSQR